MPWKNETLLTAIMTLLGSIASYANQLLNGEKFSLTVLLLQIIVSIFAGAMTYLVARYYQCPAEIIGGLSGIAGWFGAEFIKVVEAVLMKKVSGVQP